MQNKKYASTEIFLKYKGKSVDEFTTFMDKITCARVNYPNGAHKRKGLTLTKAAEKIGISINHLRLLEIGQRKLPNAAIVYNLEKVYKFQPGELAELLDKEAK